MFVDITYYTDKLSLIFSELDRIYLEVAEKYNGFNCNGCSDLCCNTVFLHFTLVEHFYLLEGFRTLQENQRTDIIKRAKHYNDVYSKTSRPEENLNLLCPLNYDNLCILYQWRPLGCRFYGVPGFMESPVKGRQDFKGCWRFESIHGKSVSERLDRTPFYRKVADLEKELRDRLRYYQRYKKTIAQMILDETNPDALIMRGYDIFEGY